MGIETTATYDAVTQVDCLKWKAGLTSVKACVLLMQLGGLMQRSVV